MLLAETSSPSLGQRGNVGGKTLEEVGRLVFLHTQIIGDRGPDLSTEISDFRRTPLLGP